MITRLSAAVCALLDAEAGFEVIAEADDIESARRYVRGHRRDVRVLDLNMGAESSLSSIPAIHAESPDTQIVVLTMQDESAYAREALTAGALDHVLKEAADTELVEAGLEDRGRSSGMRSSTGSSPLRAVTDCSDWRLLRLHWAVHRESGGSVCVAGVECFGREERPH
jgi:ActR/RegA family two-component response regulator